ncbi:MAG: hypothetical protein ACI86X_000883 [Moritella sp.]|jgi:hypothetical protein
MNKLILVAAILATLSYASFGSEEDSEPELSSAYQLNILTSCKNFAVEDNVESEMLEDYLLDCVNNDLRELGYDDIAELPFAENE